VVPAVVADARLLSKRKPGLHLESRGWFLHAQTVGATLSAGTTSA
jgi:hypothetical protein